MAAEENYTYKKQKLDIHRLFLHGLDTVAPEKIVRSAVTYHDNVVTICNRPYPLHHNRRIWVFGSGKAVGRMSMELEQILGKNIYDGIVICPYGMKTHTTRIQQFEASHPVPDLNSLTATYELMDVASDVRKSDLVIYLLSGGSSSLLCMPVDELEFEDVRALYRQLLTCGAPIDDINKIRKSISFVKGGRLRPVLGNSIVEVLAISDVPGNDPKAIGSGPLTDDLVSAAEALELLRKYRINKKIPQAIIRYLDSAQFKQLNETEQENESIDLKETGNKIQSEYITWFNILASAEKVAEAVRQGAVSLGYNAHVNAGFLTGESRKIAKKLCGDAVTVLVRDKPVPKPAALIYFGESTVTVKGNGKGGRNQEMVLGAVMALEGQHHITFLSGGTDGRDGETNAAGAIGNAQTGLSARKKGIDPESFLENNDSWNFFKKAGGLLITGVTGNNLMDIQIVLVEK